MRAVRVLPALTTTALLLSCSACTSLRIETHGEAVRIERHFGVIGVHLDAPRASVMAEMSGLGLLSAPGSLSLGYARLRFASLAAADCRVVLWLDPQATLPPETLERLKQVAWVCLMEAKLP